MNEENKAKVFEKIGRYEGLNIKRVPSSTLKIFRNFSKEEFCNDYGMALKYLVDIVFGEFPRMMNDLNLRISDLEMNKKEPEKEVKSLFKTNSGRVIEEVKCDE